MMIDNTSDVFPGESVGMRNTMHIMGILQYVCYLIAIIVIVYAIYQYIRFRSDLKKCQNEEEAKALEKEKKKKYIIPVIISYVSISVGMIFNILSNTAYKPIIYIYPKKNNTKVKVKLGEPKKLTCTYPKYKNEWNVIANTNGDLIDEETGRKYYALYWEGKNVSKPQFNDGFVVKGEDTDKFLEEKLEILGLNEREAEEFIVYWLPILEKNKYNLIRFETREEIEKEMELKVIPEPDTIIRVMMTFKPLNKKIQIPEQKLVKIERKGFTVVEWGGIK